MSNSFGRRTAFARVAMHAMFVRKFSKARTYSDNSALLLRPLWGAGVGCDPPDEEAGKEQRSQEDEVSYRYKDLRPG